MERQFVTPCSLSQLMHDKQANDEWFRSLAPTLWPNRQSRRQTQDNQVKKVTSLIYRHTVCNRLLRYTLIASLTVTKSTGRCLISPNLQFRAVVPETSPAFSLINDTTARLKWGKNYQFLIRDTRTALFELFYTRKASLSDTLSDGTTIMHVCEIINNNG
jgi:hypothetical protein